MSTSMLPGRGALARYTPSPMEQFAPPIGRTDAEEESLGSIWRVLQKRKAWIGMSALGGLLLAVVLLFIFGNQYRSTATVQIGKAAGTQANLLHDETPGAPGGADDLKTDLTTHMAVLQDDTLALAVIRNLHLQDYKPFRFKPSLLGWITGKDARIRAEQGLPLDQAPLTRDRLLTIFSKKLVVKNTPDTRLLTVTFMNQDPKLAADIANELVNQYIYFESQSQTTGPASKFLTSQLAGLKSKFEDSQQRLADFERKNGLTTTLLNSTGPSAGGGASTHILAVDRLDALNQQMTAAEQNRLGKEAIYHLTETQNPEVVIGLGSTGLPGLANSSVMGQGNGLEVLQTLRQQDNTIKVNLADLTTKDGAKNPHVLELKGQEAALAQQISDELKKINTRARNDYLLARQSEETTRQAFSQAQKEASRLNDSAVQLQVLQEEAVSSRQLYEGLYGKLQEANVQAGIHAGNIGITDPARASADPWPSRPLGLAIGLAAGLLFGISSAFMREHLDDTVQTPIQVESNLHIPVLASIPKFADGRKSRGLGDARSDEETSELILHPRSRIAESYRALRSSILLSSAGNPLQSLLVASPLVEEGKTTVAYNTGIAFAHAGKRVLLVDADMRHARLHELFGVPKSPGLNDVLANGQPAESLIRQHGSVRNLSLLPAGTRSAMPSELLGSGRFEDLLESLKEKYDLVIIDSSPMLLVADAITLSQRTDATICVIRSGVTTKTAVERVSELLQRNGSFAVGLVLNGVDTESVDFYHAYGFNGGGKYFEDHDA
jgi:succinoglycan biosynthesis transport protein ExoP